MNETRLKALRGIEALVEEDAERTIREMVADGQSWDLAHEQYAGWISDMFGSAVDRGADLCR
jgi:hypothetical protein